MEKYSNPQCPFCEPQSKAISFYSDAKFRAIYNRSPILPGHSLIVPRYHVESLHDISDTDLGHMMIFSRHVVVNLMKIFLSEAFNWTIQDGAAAGQTVPHVHLHIIPRSDGDLPHPGDWYPKLLRSESGIIDNDEREQLSESQLFDVVRTIRQKWDGN